MVLLYQLLGTRYLFGVKMESFKLSTSIPNTKIVQMSVCAEYPHNEPDSNH